MFCASLVLGLHLATYHFDRETKYEEFNPGVSVNCDNIVVGAYRNSYGDLAAYGAYNIPTGFAGVEVAVGAVVGYKAVPVMPLLVPSIKLGDVRFSLLIPTKANTGGVHLSYEF